MFFKFKKEKKDLKLDKLKIMYKNYTPLVTLLLGLLPWIGFFPKISLPVYFGVCVFGLIINVYIFMIQWDKDTEISRIKDKDIDKKLNRITTLGVYAISMFVFLGFISAALFIMPNHSYTEKHLKEVTDCEPANLNISLDNVFIKKTDTIPISQMRKATFNEFVENNDGVFFAYLKKEKDNFFIHKETFTKVICRCEKGLDETKISYVQSKYTIGSFDCKTQYIMIDIPLSE